MFSRALLLIITLFVALLPPTCSTYGVLAGETAQVQFSNLSRCQSHFPASVIFALKNNEKSNGKMEARNFENSTLAFLTEESTLSPRVNLREKIKIEFYKTYDVMTGIRIAATLGGFFSMMILLVLYKNYCKPNKTLSEEQLNAAVTAAAEEEDRALQAALEATSFYTALEKRRESLRNTNQVLLSPRFSSVGGGYSHLTPPLKVMQQRGKSLPGSVTQFASGSPTSFPENGRRDSSAKEEDADFYGQQLDYFACRNYLNVPPSRRVSSVTCSSADSAYMERRCSAFELGLPSPSHFVRHSKEKLQEKKDFYYPIDIQVIQPTPEMSPTASERNLNEEQSGCSLQVPAFNDQMHRLSVTSFEMGLAPLASISSLGSFSSPSLSLTGKSFNTACTNPVENQGCSCADDSLGSDSVFMDIEDEEFATDSEFEYDGFDDDYSFCESKQRPVSRAEMRTLQFASFDSFDASITQDSNSENMEEDTPKATRHSEEKQTVQFSCKPHTSDLKRHPSLHDGNKIKRKLMKTYSEPRSSKTKRLPTWTEKGRSGFIPKRQLSSPSSKKKKFLEENDPIQKSGKLMDKENNPEARVPNAPNIATSQEDGNAKGSTKYLRPPFSVSSSSGSPAVAPNTQKSEEVAISSPKQGINKELPLKSIQQMSVLNTQEKRSRLQKQKNFNEEASETLATKEKTDQQQTPRDSSTVSDESLLPTNNLAEGEGELAQSSVVEPSESSGDAHSNGGNNMNSK